MKLEGKITIVAGGGQGIGRGIVLCLAEEGADVAVVDINRDNARKVADEVKALGRKSLAIGADATDSKQVNQAVQEVIDAFGKIDILVNNVGGAGKATRARTGPRFVDITEAEWDEDSELNLRTHFLMCRTVAPHFQKQKSGKIVNIASIAGRGVSGRGGGRDSAGQMVYGVAKAGVIRFTRALAMVLAGDNINVNCICPGLIYTPLWEWLATHSMELRPESKGMEPREYFLRAVSGIPLGREQTPEDIGRAVAFLVSEDAKNITGQSLNVDGGLIMS